MWTSIRRRPGPAGCTTSGSTSSRWSTSSAPAEPHRRKGGPVAGAALPSAVVAQVPFTVGDVGVTEVVGSYVSVVAVVVLGVVAYVVVDVSFLSRPTVCFTLLAISDCF